MSGEPRKSLEDHWSFLEEELEKFQRIVADLEAIGMKTRRPGTECRIESTENESTENCATS